MPLRAVPAAMLRSKVEKAEQRTGPGAAARSLARAVAAVEIRPASVGIPAAANASLHFPRATRAAITPAGIRNPDRGGTLGLRVRGLMDNAALENHLGPL